MNTAAGEIDPQRTTVLTGTLLFDGEELTADATVVIKGQRIAGIGRDVALPRRAEVVDLPGATLLPGLIDTHVHLAFDASEDPVGRLRARDDTEALAAMAEAARGALRGGVTTVRDLGDRGYLSLKLRDSGSKLLPTILAAGPPTTTPNGHCHFLGGAAAAGLDGVRAAVRAACVSSRTRTARPRSPPGSTGSNTSPSGAARVSTSPLPRSSARSWRARSPSG